MAASDTPSRRARSLFHCLAVGFVSFLFVGCQTNAERLCSLAAKGEYLIVRIEPDRVGPEYVRHVAWDLERGVGLVLPDASGVVRGRARWTKGRPPQPTSQSPSTTEWRDWGERADLCGMNVSCSRPPFRSPLYPRLTVTSDGRTWTFDGWPADVVVVSDESDTTVPFVKRHRICWLGLVDGVPKTVRTVSVGDGVGETIISPDGKQAVWAWSHWPEHSVLSLLLMPGLALFPPEPQFAYVFADITGSSARSATLPRLDPAKTRRDSFDRTWKGWIHRDTARHLAIETVPLPKEGDEAGGVD